MVTGSNISKNKFANGLLCGAVASGVAVAASLGGVGPANATCVSFNGFNLGDGCTSSRGGFAIGIGDGTAATANGLLAFAIATGADTVATSVGALSLALAGGTNVMAQAGREGGGDFANVAVNLGNAEELEQSGVLQVVAPLVVVSLTSRQILGETPTKVDP